MVLYTTARQDEKSLHIRCWSENDIIMNVRSCRAASRSVHHGWQQSQTCGGSDQLLEIQGKMV